jgi:hypothetical protein
MATAPGLAPGIILRSCGTGNTHKCQDSRVQHQGAATGSPSNATTQTDANSPRARTTPVHPAASSSHREDQTPCALRVPQRPAKCGHQRALTATPCDGWSGALTCICPGQKGFYTMQNWWSGAGSNCRPSAFQVGSLPAPVDLHHRVKRPAPTCFPPDRASLRGHHPLAGRRGRPVVPRAGSSHREVGVQKAK